MTLNEITIRVERLSGRTRFRFETASGPVLAMMVAVNKEGAERPIWSLVPEGAAEFPFSVSSSPIEDPNPSGRHSEGGEAEGRWTLEEIEGQIALAKSNCELRDLVYGEVPLGFRQALPRKGQPPPLEAGQAYVISVVGACYGQTRFEC